MEPRVFIGVVQDMTRPDYYAAGFTEDDIETQLELAKKQGLAPFIIANIDRDHPEQGVLTAFVPFNLATGLRDAQRVYCEFEAIEPGKSVVAAAVTPAYEN